VEVRGSNHGSALLTRRRSTRRRAVPSGENLARHPRDEGVGDGASAAGVDVATLLPIRTRCRRSPRIVPTAYVMIDI